MSTFPADPTEHLKLLWEKPIDENDADLGESPAVPGRDVANVPHRVRRGTKQNKA